MVVSARGSKVFSVASHRDFLGLLVDWILGVEGLDEDPMKLAEVRVYLPNRRLTRGLKIRLLESCRDREDKRSLIFPRIEALGDVSVTEELYDDFIEQNYETSNDICSALEPMGKSLILYKLVSAWLKARGEKEFGIEHTLGLSESLGYLLDELDLQEVEKETLDSIVPEELSSHWQISRDFLRILRKEFPKICESRGQINGMERRVKSLRYLVDHLSREGREGPVIIAGSTGSIASTAALMKKVVELPQGLLILPGLDRFMSDEVWSRLDSDLSHPQHGLHNILNMLELKRQEIPEWQESPTEKKAPIMGQAGIGQAGVGQAGVGQAGIGQAGVGQAGIGQVGVGQAGVGQAGVGQAGVGQAGMSQVDMVRQQLLSHAMTPSSSYESWSKSLESEISTGSGSLANFSLFEAENAWDEVLYISLLLRQSLEHGLERSALISPDRGLIKSVIAEMRRWGVYIDDAAGERALISGSGLLISILLDMLSDDNTKQILCLLHHPMCRMGLSRKEMLRVLSFVSDFRRETPSQPKTLPEMKNQINKYKNRNLEDKTLSLLFLGELQTMLRPFFLKKSVSFQEHLEHFVSLCEQVSRGDGQGLSSIWRTAEGEKLSEGILKLKNYGDILDEKMDVRSFCSMLRGLLNSITFHERRSNQSRLMILEPMEARLHKFDLVVLGGLNEGVWPRSIASSPWMSRSMREQLGLLSQERSVGLQAHDFMQACGAKRVVLTRAKVLADEPQLESRWLARIKVVMKHKNLSFDDKSLEKVNKAWEWTRKTVEIPRYKRPKITLKPHIFPKKISVTSVDRLREDPYVFYAQKLLKLKVPEDMIGDLTYQVRGILLHRLIKEINDFSEQHPSNGEKEISNFLDEKLNEELTLETELSSILKLLWQEKLRKIGQQYIKEELIPTKAITSNIFSEQRGEVTLAKDVVLEGIADRLDLLKDGKITIVDLKTGAKISKKKITSLEYSQLSLLGLIGFNGGFSINREAFQDASVALFFLKNKYGGRIEVRLEECRVSGSWWEDAEEIVVNEICQYFEAKKSIEAPRVLGRNYASWSRFNRFAEWGYDD